MHFTAFDTSDDLAEWLARHVAKQLSLAVDEKGWASLAVSGGTTPKQFFKKLSGQEIAWEKVWVTLVDERWVPPDSNRSNQKMVTLDLLQDKAAKAQFLPLYIPEKDPDAVQDREDEIRRLMPLDVMVLGMGTDGHTASLFPGGDNLAAATDDGCKAFLLPMNVPNGDVERVTMTLPVICSAKDLVLHIEGAEKRSVLEHAQDSVDPARLPIKFVLRQCPDLRVVWAP